jgi:D-alanine-D-alanine ligase
VLAKKFIDGTEFTVGISAPPRCGGHWNPPRRFYDFEAKYLRDDTQYHCGRAGETQEMALGS